MGNREGSWRAEGSGYGNEERTGVVGHGVARCWGSYIGLITKRLLVWYR